MLKTLEERYGKNPSFDTRSYAKVTAQMENPRMGGRETLLCLQKLLGVRRRRPHPAGQADLGTCCSFPNERRRRKRVPCSRAASATGISRTTTEAAEKAGGEGFRAGSRQATGRLRHACSHAYLQRFPRWLSSGHAMLLERQRRGVILAWGNAPGTTPLPAKR